MAAVVRVKKIQGSETLGVEVRVLESGVISPCTQCTPPIFYLFIEAFHLFS